MKFRLYIFILLLIVDLSTTYAQQVPTPAPPQKGSVLIMNAKAHLGNGQAIENSAIGMRDGQITLVADATTIRINGAEYDTIIYADGMHVYPGFFAPNSTLGLHELDLVRQTNDLAEVGTFRPSIRSVIAYNTESEIIPTVRNNGILMGQIVPRDGVISGTSCVVQFDAWNWEDAVVRMDDGVHLNWPGVFHKHYDKGALRLEKVKSYDQQLREIESFFSGAKAYCQDKSPVLTEVRYEALRNLFNGKATLYVHASDVKQIQEALRFKKDMGISSMVIVGGYDAHLCADLLKESNVSVMISRVHSLPRYDEDDVYLTYRLPAMLYEKGVNFCFENSGDMERMGARNIPFHAGTAVAYGLPYEQAVKALTLSAAQILGVSDRCGSIETGKDATIFISTGDALDIRTNQVVHAWIEGRKIDLSSKHTVLYQKWKSKYDDK